MSDIQEIKKLLSQMHYADIEIVIKEALLQYKNKIVETTLDQVNMMSSPTVGKILKKQHKWINNSVDPLLDESRFTEENI